MHVENYTKIQRKFIFWEKTVKWLFFIKIINQTREKYPNCNKNIAVLEENIIFLLQFGNFFGLANNLDEK